MNVAKKYTNSDLVSYTQLSPYHSGQRKYDITRISPHCFVGQVSVERAGKSFANRAPGREASCNYAIGLDGRVALIVEEKNRSWCTSSPDNDNRAITIECASDATTPYAFKPECFDSLVKLSADICRRNGKNKLVWIPDKNRALSYVPAPGEMLITVHRWFANKACPGNWLMSKMDEYVQKVNAELNNSVHENNKNTPTLENGYPVQEGPRYRVQTGSYAKVGNAKRQAEQLNKEGFPAYVTAHNGKFRTQIGAYINRAEADAMAKKLRDSGYKTYITYETRGDDIR